MPRRSFMDSRLNEPLSQYTCVGTKCKEPNANKAIFFLSHIGARTRAPPFYELACPVLGHPSPLQILGVLFIKESPIANHLLKNIQDHLPSALILLVLEKRVMQRRRATLIQAGPNTEMAEIETLNPQFINIYFLF